ncbi:uncharacterized protein [Argopecten irradians]|uniref:uncharacterized protein n=1 Tax=Argopecten irradians TaxID=31199 RepID=UPI00371C10B9
MAFVWRNGVRFFFFYLSTTVVCVRADTCENVRTETISDVYLGGSGYKTVSPCGYQQCLSLCMAARECQSINYDLVRLTCELNTDTYTAASSLSVRDGNIYKDMNGTDNATAQIGNCQKSTCPDYHTCVKLTNGSRVCMAPVPDIQTTTTTSTTSKITTSTTTTTMEPTTTALTCVAPYTLNHTADLCLYYGTSYTWAQANNNCPGSGRLYVADTTDKRAAADAMCPADTSCWLGAAFNGGTCTWSTGDVFAEADSGTGDCLRVRNSVFKGGSCTTAVSYICEQI